MISAGVLLAICKSETISNLVAIYTDTFGPLCGASQCRKRYHRFLCRPSDYGFWSFHVLRYTTSLYLDPPPYALSTRWSNSRCYGSYDSISKSDQCKDIFDQRTRIQIPFLLHLQSLSDVESIETCANTPTRISSVLEVLSSPAQLVYIQFSEHS
jgi:hypothetical protein